MDGGWYDDVADILDSTVEDALAFIRFLEYSLQNNASSIIKYIELKREENDQVTSNTVLIWSNYLIYGVKDKLQIDLMEIDLPDRITVLVTSVWFTNNGYDYGNQKELKDILFFNRPSLITFLESRIPKISFNNLYDFFGPSFEN